MPAAGFTHTHTHTHTHAHRNTFGKVKVMGLTVNQPRAKDHARSKK